MLALNGVDTCGPEVLQTTVDVADEHAKGELLRPGDDHFVQHTRPTKPSESGEKYNVEFVVGIS